MNKNDLKPAIVFEEFAKINKIPRPSKHEEKMIDYLKNWGVSRGLDTNVDETGNVIIRKPATKGMENCKTVILQSHMDMVCDKLVDVEFDFDKDAIKTYVDGEWLTAEGTTLGADDGIGCAIELAILASEDVKHGPLECVFTRDEETGLTGISVEQFHTYSTPGRDPRERIITVSYCALVDGLPAVKGCDDAAAAKWFPLEDVPHPLAFDHDDMLRDALRFLNLA